ncbi:sigma-54 interaction domain-containing protein [Desulfitobacterium hafniense]|uniref:sigma-54 interaction domain-containing protein n=1 Tax=Desulfitobacterium hafniense TaxID=49338 RepID=UPI000361AEE5|nr:sigma-54-dependent Fis family transcriptional regulator [Desulfitobacterium hafniense]
MVNEFWTNTSTAQIHHEILELISEGIYVTDTNGKTLAVNHMYEQLTGLKREELVGRSVIDLKNEGKFDVLTYPEVKSSGQKKIILQTTKANRKVLCTGYPIFDKEQKVALVITFVRDLTLMNQLKEQIADQQKMIEKYREVNNRYKKEFAKDSPIFESEEMLQVMEKLKIISKSDATVLLLGETGVGKDVLSRKIHEYSPRCNEPFLKIDCSSIPENLLESELFGYESGAFSGASHKGKAGLLEMADKGTIFLDEIGEIPLQMQVKLLRVLQDQEFIHVGSTKVRKVNIRFIAATNRDLSEEVRKGNFRSDLYYRLHVAVLNIPPLRERKDDIQAMVKFFLKMYNTKYYKDITFSKHVEKVLQCYKWPGNARELENFIQGVVVSHENGIFDVSDLPQYMLADTVELEDTNYQDDQKSLNKMVEDYERDLLKKALQKHGSADKAAKALKVDRSTIFRKIKKYDLNQ